RALEIDRPGWVTGQTPADDRLDAGDAETIRAALRTPTPERIFQVKRAMLAGVTVEEGAALPAIDPWLLQQLAELLAAEREFHAAPSVSAAQLRTMKRMGFSDRQLADLRGVKEGELRSQRWGFGIHPAYKVVDTCAGEFPSK